MKKQSDRFKQIVSMKKFTSSKSMMRLFQMGPCKGSIFCKSVLSRHGAYLCRETHLTYCQYSKYNILKLTIPCCRQHNLLKITLKHRLIKNEYRFSSTKNTGKHDQVILCAVYGSFAVGFVLLCFIAMKEYTKKRLRDKGVFELKIPAWKRLQLYTYKDFVLPEFVVNQLDDLNDFQTTKDDIWVVSFPRSGTTWLQEIVYLVATNVNMYGANNVILDERFPYIEFMYPGAKKVSSMPSPRLIKSHLPLSLLPKSVEEQKPKIIYIARNPKDVVTSYYYFIRLLHPVTRYQGDFNEFFDLFMKDEVMYAPWSNHVKEFWNHKDQDNILFLTYEELKQDTSGTIDKVATFLGKTVTETQKTEIMHHCSFDQMKNNKATNHIWFVAFGVSDPKAGTFMRKGCIGDWANHLTPDMSRQVSQMVVNTFHDTDLHFAYQGSHVVDDDTPETES